MRTDVEFDAEGVTLRGWLYRPDGGSARAPAVVMAHGFSAVKEMYLDAYADAFQASGLAVLVFDNRGFGASDGEPRQEIDPWTQVRDYRHAITWIQLLGEYEPGGYIEQISPTLMVVAAGDHLAVSDLALEAYGWVREPKRLELLPGGHFDAYTGSGFERASTAATNWFRTHLQP